MKGKKHKPEQIIKKLMQADIAILDYTSLAKRADTAGISLDIA